MFNLGDDSELDSFSREAAGKYSPPGEPNWEKLSAELDKVLPVEEKKRRFVFFWWLLPVMLIGGVVTYWLISKNEPLQSVATKNDVKKSGTDASVSLPSVSSEKVNNTEAAVTTSTPKQHTEPNTIATQKESSNTTPTKATDQSTKTSVKNSIQKNSNLSLSGLRKEIAPQKVQQPSSQKMNVTVHKDDNKTTASSSSPNNQSVAVTQQQNTSDQKTKQENLITEKSSEEGVQTIIARKEDSNETITKTDTTKPTITENTTIADKKLTAATKGKGFSYSFLAGVDKSTVKFSYGYDPGYNFGVMGGYHFNSKISVHTGLIYTRKQYKMEGADFTAPKGTPISYYKLDLVDGYCKMWEVPLLFRYTMPRANGNSFFLSAGLSSYFMTNENYNYYYKYLGTPVVKNNSYNSTDTHILSIVHLSAGFSKPFGKSWDLQMEPYAKIPLGGVGFGNIELSSFGINFSVQHRQPSKK